MLTPSKYDPAKYEQMTEPCRKGHLSIRYRSNGACWACQNVRRSKYRQNGGYVKQRAAQKAQYHLDPVASAKRAKEARQSRETAHVSKAWRANNPDKVKKYSEKYVRENRARKASLAAAYTARKLSATPSWADQARIRKVYRLAEELSKLTGVPHEVDHIVPLRGRNVCGLHVHNNLRAIPSKENRMKYNKLQAND